MKERRISEREVKAKNSSNERRLKLTRECRGVFEPGMKQRVDTELSIYSCTVGKHELQHSRRRRAKKMIDEPIFGPWRWDERI